MSCLPIVLACCGLATALEPNEILVIANTDHAASTRLARYYCERRGIPDGHVISVSLGTRLRGTISRADYESRLAHPIRRIFSTREDLAHIKCLVTTYGVPYRVGGREPLSGHDAQLAQLRRLEREQKDAMARLEEKGQTKSALYRERDIALRRIEMEMDRIAGKETGASVDSELSLVVCGSYELYRWQPNALRLGGPQVLRTLMVSRLDGPNYAVAKGLVDKAIAAEKTGLTGTAYVDSRGLSAKDLYTHYDRSLRELATLIRLRASMPVREERTSELFPPGSCPDTALYCGWYSLRKYVDAFDFVEGAVGYHIASYEAAHLRDPNSSEWCSAMLMDGITATLGPVSEPYLHAFPEPKAFFATLLDGHCLVETFYLTKPLNSWKMLLIGDPLYRPFPSQKRDIEPPQPPPDPNAS